VNEEFLARQANQHSTVMQLLTILDDWTSQLDAGNVTTEAGVVMSYACVDSEWRGVAIAYWSPIRNLSSGINQMTVFETIIAVLHCLLNGLCVGLLRIHVNVAVNWVCAWRAVHTTRTGIFEHNIIQSLGNATITRSPTLRSISYRLIDMNPGRLINMNSGRQYAS